jgi:hypothetical protein
MAWKYRRVLWKFRKIYGRRKELASLALTGVAVAVATLNSHRAK